MITYKELREKAKSNRKYKGCVVVDRPPLMHPGFPGQFNLSFTEYELNKEYGGYTNFNHDFVFSCIPWCIRQNDIFDEATKQSKFTSPDHWKYLGVFEMSDIYGMIHLSKDRSKEPHTQQTREVLRFISEQGIPLDCIYPSYQAGEKVVEITGGKYNFDFTIPEDVLAKQLFLAAGIPAQNIIPDRSRNTLLSLHLYRESANGGVERVVTPWGYRNEINVNFGSRVSPFFVDVGTLERFCWIPYKVGEEIVGLNEIEDTISIGAVGLERLCMVANKLLNIRMIDSIKPFYDCLGENNVLGGESLRALHAIYADILRYDLQVNLGHRKNRIRKLLRFVDDMKLDSTHIRELLQVNTEIQPWHPELIGATDFLCHEIEEYSSRRTW